MPTIDYGSVTVSVDDETLETFFPFEHGEVKTVLKRFRSQFINERKSWITVPERVGKSPETILAELEKCLWQAAPKQWPDVVEHFSTLACTTKRYEIKFGAGGLRLMMPEGHPGHYDLDKLEGAKRQYKGTIWTIPARYAVPSIIMPLVKRIHEEDKKLFVKAVEPYEGRVARGTFKFTPEEADTFGLVEGQIVFAEYPFLKVADPTIVNMPVHAWPLRVISRKDQPGEGYQDIDYGIDVKLEYPEYQPGYTAVRLRMVKSKEERLPALDSPHALGKWHARMRK